MNSVPVIGSYCQILYVLPCSHLVATENLNMAPLSSRASEARFTESRRSRDRSALSGQPLRTLYEIRRSSLPRRTFLRSRGTTPAKLFRELTSKRTRIGCKLRRNTPLYSTARCNPGRVPPERPRSGAIVSTGDRVPYCIAGCNGKHTEI